MKSGWKTRFLLILFLACAVLKADGPSLSITTWSATYLIGDTTTPKTSVSVTLPTTIATRPVTAVAASTPQGWLAVYQVTGSTKLTYNLQINPATLVPGNYSGTVTFTTTPASTTAVLSVTLLVKNPPATLQVNDPSAPNTSPTLAFSYTTSANPVAPSPLALNVVSSGDIIPFSVTVGNVGKTSTGSTALWARVYQTGQLPTTTTSGVALAGAVVQMNVGIDLTVLKTLDQGQYNEQITFTANNGSNSTVVVPVTLQVNAGAPVLRASVPIFPSTVVGGVTTDQVINVYGDNFFLNTTAQIQQGTAIPVALQKPTWLSRQVIQVTIPYAQLAVFPATWTLSILNANQTPVSTTFDVIDPSQPSIGWLVNSASYLPGAVQTGTNKDPLSPGEVAVSPREIVSIYGQNLAPANVPSIIPSGTPAVYPTTVSGVTVDFIVGSGAGQKTYASPISLAIPTQINCVVPKEVDGSVSAVTVRVTNSAGFSTYAVKAIPADPGVFTFGTAGQGQAAVLNYDTASGSYAINSDTNKAARGAPVSIYVTGLGDFDPATPLANGAVAPASPVYLANKDLVHVDIDGQPAVVSYAGSTPGTIVGLVQINAWVPPGANAKTDSITVSIGDAQTSRRSQPGATIAVK
jgi:uncharacterized protein (TIGR03437 family)